MEQAWEFGKLLFEQDEEKLSDKIPWSLIKQTEKSMFGYYYRWLENENIYHSKQLYLRAIIVYAKEPDKLYQKLWRHINVIMRKSNMFQEWMLHESCLNNDKWLFLLKNELIILDKKFSLKLLNHLKDQNLKDIMTFMMKLKTSIWFEHYKRFSNLLIDNDVLKEKCEEEIFQQSFQLPEHPGVYQFNEDVIGYKVLQNFEETLIAQVIIPAHSKIVVPNKKPENLRTNCYKINLIMNRKGEIKNYGYGPIQNQLYHKGETISIHNLDEYLYEHCVPGLHFYPSFDIACRSEYMNN